MLKEKLGDRKIILASKSPRRQQLLKSLDLEFEVRTKEVNEDFPQHLKAQEIPLYLVKKKADAFRDELTANEILITSDTIVWVNHHVLNKPDDEQHAFEMLQTLSGKMHQVFTAVNLLSGDKELAFFCETKVYFKDLTPEEIHYYIRNYRPFDKAGAYGAQDWIGCVAVEKLDGSYFNVMGLPVHLLYQELLNF